MAPVKANGSEGGAVTQGSGRRHPEVRGNTLRVYLFLLREGPSELRQVQRSLELSTPSLASYHLDKLVSLGYASQNPLGQYFAVKEAASEILEGFTKVGSLVVPQLFFFAVLFSILTSYFAYASFVSSAYLPFLAATSVAVVVILWYQTFRSWKTLGDKG